MKRRRTLVAAALAFIVASAGLVWGAGRFIRSPAELAASTAAPEPSLITVPVERRTLTSDVVVRGVVRLGEPRTVTLAGTPGGPEAAAAVVTRAPEQGAEVAEGAVALEVSGRPVLVLGGDIPTYRDLRPGDVGDDVAQLEAGLARLGHDPGPVDRTYDVSTEAAITRWYAAVGYPANGPSDEEDAALDAAADALVAAEQAERAARRALDEARRGPGRETVVAADAAVRGARDAVATATVSAEAAIATAQRAVDETAAALAAAERTAAQLRAEGADPPAIAEADAVVYGALVARDEAAAGLRVTRSEVDALVRQAHDAVAVAEAERAALDRRAGTDVEAEELAAAREQAGSARDDLSELEAELGVTLPAAEVVFLPGLPLRVDAVAVERGDDATGELMTVTGTGLAIDSSLSLSEQRLVAAGAAVQIEESSLGISVPGSVARIAEEPGTDDLDAQSYYMEVTPAEAPPELQDASVRITIPVESTDGEVLAVPVAALSAAADGTSRVEVAVGDGDETRSVTVTPGLSAEGLVEVEAVEGELSESDRVVVGR